MVNLTTNSKVPVPVSAARQNTKFNCVQLYLSPSAEAADAAGCGLWSAERGSSAGQFTCIFLHLIMIIIHMYFWEAYFSIYPNPRQCMDILFFQSRSVLEITLQR